jgi:uncharacterized protein (TIGR02271 family)
MHNENQNQALNSSASSSSRDADRRHVIEASEETVQLETVSSTTGPRIHEANTPVVVQLREEELEAHKQWVEAGAVLVRKEIETTTDTFPVQVGYEEVHVERVPVNLVLGEDESIAPRQEGDTWIVPVVEEELVVMKRRVVREELRITKRVLTREEQVSGEVRKERLNIDTTGNLQSSRQADR